MGKGLEKSCLQRCTNSQQACENMLKITNQGSVNQNHEILLHTIRMDVIKRTLENKVLLCGRTFAQHAQGPRFNPKHHEK